MPSGRTDGRGGCGGFARKHRCCFAAMGVWGHLSARRCFFSSSRCLKDAMRRRSLLLRYIIQIAERGERVSPPEAVAFFPICVCSRYYLHNRALFVFPFGLRAVHCRIMDFCTMVVAASIQSTISRGTQQKKWRSSFLKSEACALHVFICLFFFIFLFSGIFSKSLFYHTCRACHLFLGPLHRDAFGSFIHEYIHYFA